MYLRTVSSIWPPPMMTLRPSAQSGGFHLLDGGLHGVEGHAEETGEGQDLGLVFFDGFHEVLFGLVDTEVVDLKAVDFQHEAHDVFADVVDVAAHGA